MSVGFRPPDPPPLCDGPPRVLLVMEGNNDLEVVIVNRFESAGWVTQLTRTFYSPGASAAAVLRDFRPHAVVIGIGDMNHYWLTRNERWIFDPVKPVLIGIAGWQHKCDERWLERFQFAGYVAKPVNVERLVTLARELVAARYGS